jgi:hypothetical protein
VNKPATASNVMIAIGLVPAGLWLGFVVALGGVPMDLTWMGILGISGLFAYGAALFVSGIAALQVIREPQSTGRPSTITWVLVFITAIAVLGPWVFLALRTGSRG